MNGILSSNWNSPLGGQGAMSPMGNGGIFGNTGLLGGMADDSGLGSLGGIGGGMGGFGGSASKLMPKLMLGLGGLQTIGGLWQAFEANKLAKQQFKFTKDVTNTNIANQIKAYNTTLADRSRSRAVVEGQSAETAQAYVDQNKATRSGTGG